MEQQQTEQIQEQATEQQHHVKVEHFERNLRCTLDDKGVAERADRAARLFGEIESREEELKAENKQRKAQIANVETELRRVNLEIRDRAHFKDVPCERRFVFRTGKVEEVRLDSNEVLSERAMRDDERQLELAGTDKAKAEAKNGAGEESNGHTEAPPLATEKKKRGGGRKKKDTEEN